MTRYIIIVLALLSGITVHAQETMTLQDAIDAALQSNYGIKIARNNAAISENSAQPGNAGLLPNIDASGGVQYQNQNVQQTFAGDFPANDVNGAASTTYNAQVAVTYNLFDGMGTINTFKKLKAQRDLGNIQARLTIEGTLLSVVNAYYSAVQIQQNRDLVLEAITISNDRYERAKARYEVGGGARIDMLNAEVDLNADSISLVNAESNLDNAKREINQLLGRAADTEFELNTEVKYRENFDVQTLRDSATINNAAILVATHQLSSAEYDRKIASSTIYPRLDGSAAYGWTQQANETGILLENTSVGFTGGLTLSWNLFDGKRKYIQMQNAQLAIQSNREQYNQSVGEVDKSVLNAYTNYINSLNVAQIEQRNVKTAELNFERTKELYSLGQVNNTQFREAQVNLLRVKQRINDAAIQTKLAEVELLRLSGQLVKE